MFRVLSFLLGFRMSLSAEGFGRMPRRCAATIPFFRKRHPYAQSSLSLRWGRRCGGWASNGIDLSRFVWFESLVWRRIPIHSSWLVLRWIEGIIIRCSVRRLPTFNCAYVHWRRWNGRRSRRLRWLGAVFLILLNNGHRSQHIEGVGWEIEIVQTWRHYRVLRTECIRECWLIGVRLNGDYLWLRRSDGGNCYRLRVHSSR